MFFVDKYIILKAHRDSKKSFFIWNSIQATEPQFYTAALLFTCVLTIYNYSDNFYGNGALVTLHLVTNFLQN